jgi:hypothetical protein
MLKINLSIILCSSFLYSNEILNPLPSSARAIDNGGVKSAIDAYKDGIGAELVDKPGVATDNSAMNVLTIKYGEDAKINNTTILNQVLNGNSNPTAADLTLAGRLTIDGSACNDGNIDTNGETWLNGVCQGGVQSVFRSCKEILIAGNSIGDGIYTIDIDGSSGGISQFNVYCDMTTDGGGWMLTHSWSAGISVALSVNNVSVKGQPLVTLSTNTTTYPVLKSGIINNFNEQLVVSNHPSFVSTIGNKFKYNLFDQAQLPLTSLGFNVHVISSNLDKKVYGTRSGWGVNTLGTDLWGVWTAWGNGGLCGGSGIAGTYACPALMSPYTGHFDQSYLKQIYVR